MTCGVSGFSRGLRIGSVGFYVGAVTGLEDFKLPVCPRCLCMHLCVLLCMCICLYSSLSPTYVQYRAREFTDEGPCREYCPSGAGIVG